ncbi:MAG: tandem-95 repeat protein, partial [Burkholderiales bacterium]|nr:tandem-95 repeat protein [Burkholderiales bacterium]
QLAGADDVSLEHLSLTGSLYGLHAASGADSDRITLANLDVYGNASRGISVESSNDEWLVAGNRLHNNTSYGLYMSDSRRSRVEGNEVYSQSYGISASVNSNWTDQTVVSGNLVHDNSTTGISIGYYVLAIGNEVYRQPTGIDVNSGRAEANRVHHNSIGIDTAYGSVTAKDNWIYANTAIGIRTYATTITGNHVFSNSVGIHDTAYSRFENNLVYANTNIGTRIASAHTPGNGLYNNTIYQPVGDAVKFESASNVTFGNNIVRVDAGYGLNVDGGTLATLASDWNLFHTTTSNAHVALSGGANRTTLADWRAVSNDDLNSRSADPKFLDIDGADNVLGEQGVATGNGFDDNFGLDALSPAIDAASAYIAPRTDIEGRNRHDDPTTTNTGTGLDLFVAQDTGASSYSAIGTAQEWHSTNGVWQLALGFNFSFYGKVYNKVWVSSNGYLHFGDSGQYDGGDGNSADGLKANVRIAPLWDNLTTPASGTPALDKDIYVDTSTANQVTIRWQAARQESGGGDVNFAATLFANGSVRFDYGPGNQNLTPTIGVSAGNGETFVLAAYDGQANLNGANSLAWTPAPGLVYYDIGAYEFQGNSGDTTAPQVVAITNLPDEGETTALAFASVQVSFSEPLDGVSARSPANYELREAGSDGVFDNQDDVIITVTPFYTYPETNLTLSFGAILAEGDYRLTLSGTKAIYDTAGNPLDGDGNGGGGDDWVRHFTIDRSNNIAPIAQNQSVTVAENGSIVLTLVGNDANGDTLAYSIVTQPAHGALSAPDPATHQVTYTPNAGYNGPDSFLFMVDDGNTGVDTGAVNLTVTPVNAAPAGADQAVSLPEDGDRLIVLDGSDAETSRADLAFNLVNAPLHGTLVQGASGAWTYVPHADFNGADGFTYTVTDRGDPDGTLGNALTSPASTVSITVTPSNDAPSLAAVADQVVAEGATLLVSLSGSDIEGDTLFYSLVSFPAGALIDQASGVFSWTPGDGPASASVTVRVAETGDPTQFDETSFDITVVNVPPVLTLSGPASVLRGDTYTLALGVVDPGDDTIGGWTIHWGDGGSDTIAGNPASIDHVYSVAGAFQISASASDEDGSYDAAPAGVVVTTPNVAPVAANPNVLLLEDGTAVITLTATDGNGDVLSYSVLTQPGHGVLSVLDPATRQLTYTPAANYHGTDSFTFRATDPGGLSDDGVVTLTVNPVNDAPVLVAIADVAVQEGQTVSFTASASDVDTLDTLTYSLVSAPAGATIDPLTGVFNWVAADGNATYPVTVRVTDNGSPAEHAEQAFAIDVTAGHLQLRSLTPTATGFHARFNHAFDDSVINLYSSELDPLTSLGAADVVLTGPGSTPVRGGSLVFDADRAGFTFVKTGAVLATGSYTVTLKSGDNAFKDGAPNGALGIAGLDGNGDGTPGDDRVETFNVVGSGIPVLSIGDVVRGNGQEIDLPASADAGIPIRLSNAAGVSTLAFTLRLAGNDGTSADPLIVDSIELAPGLAGRATLSAPDLSDPTAIRVTVTANSGQDLAVAGDTRVAIVRAHVGADAAYGSKQVLDLDDIEVNATAGGALDDDGLQVVALLGDTSGLRSYETADLALLQRVVVRYDTGFLAYPNADPVLIGDINGSGALTALDVTRLLQEIRFLTDPITSPTDRPEIPAIPPGVGPLDAFGPDPRVEIDKTFSAKPGETFVVPVRLDTSAGLSSVQLRLHWEAAALDLVGIARGSMTGDFQWYVERQSAGELYVDLSRLSALTGGSGSLLELSFRVAADATPRVVDLDLAWVKLNEGRLTLNPLPRPGRDGADGQVTIEALAPAPQPDLPEAPVAPKPEAAKTLMPVKADPPQPSAPAKSELPGTSAPAKPELSATAAEAKPGWAAVLAQALKRSFTRVAPAPSEVASPPLPALATAPSQIDPVRTSVPLIEFGAMPDIEFGAVSGIQATSADSRAWVKGFVSGAAQKSANAGLKVTLAPTAKLTAEPSARAHAEV